MIDEAVSNPEPGSVVSPISAATADRPSVNGIPIPNLNAMARNTGISVTYLSRIFNGHRRPSMRMSNKIATHMGISLDDLYGMLSAIPQRPVQRSKRAIVVAAAAAATVRFKSKSKSKLKKR